ncbi:MAG: hypothetical protein ACJA1A_001638 [Saprospiraceae bacterium]
MQNIKSMIKKSLMLLILLIVIMPSCEKEEFTSIVEEPVFIAAIPFAKTDSVGFNAGDDQYYMYASHAEIEEEIVYSGLFGKEESCESGCAENFAIQIHQKKSLEENLSTGNYPFYSVPRDGYKHNYSLITNDSDPLQNIFWRVGDEFLSGESISIDSDNDTAPGDGIKLVYNLPNTFTVQFERQILPMTVDCDITVAIAPTSEGLQIEVITSSPFSQVSWANGLIGNTIIANTNIATYTARVFGGSGCTTDIAINLQNMNLTSSYTIGFNQSSFGFSTPDNPNNAVSISYTSEDGVFYTSSTIGQILPFKFDVLDISEYEENEIGNPTWKITANFDCILFGENGGTRRIRDGQAVFAVSY